MSGSKIPSIYEDDNTRVIKLNIRTTPANESPAEFRPYYIRVPKDIPDYIIQEMIYKEVERIQNNLDNWREWDRYMDEADKATRDGLYKSRFIRGVDLLKKRSKNDNY